jgi:hypothetical protein
MASTREKGKIYLLNGLQSEMTGAKLPSIEMVLKVFLHHHITKKQTIQDFSSQTVS